MNCSCGSDDIGINQSFYKTRFSYRGKTYLYKTITYISICKKCYKTWNDLDQVSFQVSCYFDYIKEMLDILLKEVSLGVAIERGLDYLTNGFNGKRKFRLDANTLNELYDLIENVLTDIDYENRLKYELVLSTVNSQSTLA